MNQGDDEKIEAYEDEIFGVHYLNVPEEFKNPCSRLMYIQYRDNLTRMNDKVYKKVIKPGSGSDVDYERSKVTYDYAFFTELSEDPFDSSFLNKQPGIIDVKEGIEPLPGVYLAIATMKDQEEAVFWISNDVMFGKLGKELNIHEVLDVK